MPDPNDHTEARKSLCGICFRKMPELRDISAEQELQIQNVRYTKFSLSDPQFPNVICRSCSFALSAHSKVKVIINSSINYNYIYVVKYITGA